MGVIVGFGFTPFTIQTNMDNTSNSVFNSQNLIFKSAFAQESVEGQFQLEEISESSIAGAFLISIVSIVIIILVFKKLSKRSLKEIIQNDAGYPTLSKFQFLLWTLVVAFTYLAIQIIIVIGTDYSGDYLIQDIPENLLAMMGISVAVPIIASKKVAIAKKINKEDTRQYFGSMFYNIQGKLDLARLQMFLWTIIGIGIYLHVVFDQIMTLSSTEELFLPDVSPTLLILMGLSQGAYLGSKFAGGNPQENPPAPNPPADPKDE